MKYKVMATQTLFYEVEVEAASLNEAHQRGLDMIFDYDDHTDEVMKYSVDGIVDDVCYPMLATWLAETLGSHFTKIDDKWIWSEDDDGTVYCTRYKWHIDSALLTEVINGNEVLVESTWLDEDEALAVVIV